MIIVLLAYSIYRFDCANTLFYTEIHAIIIIIYFVPVFMDNIIVLYFL